MTKSSGMSQRTSNGLHAAIIMDGNGRWASARGLPRVAGHRAGAEALRRTVEAAPDLGIGVLTVYAFSSDNWRRPQTEVSALMKMFHIYLRREQAKCVEKGVRVSVIGRRDRLPRLLLPVIDECVSATAQGGGRSCQPREVELQIETHDHDIDPALPPDRPRFEGLRSRRLERLEDARPAEHERPFPRLHERRSR